MLTWKLNKDKLNNIETHQKYFTKRIGKTYVINMYIDIYRVVEYKSIKNLLWKLVFQVKERRKLKLIFI